LTYLAMAVGAEQMRQLQIGSKALCSSAQYAMIAPIGQERFNLS